MARLRELSESGTMPPLKSGMSFTEIGMPPASSSPNDPLPTLRAHAGLLYDLIGVKPIFKLAEKLNKPFEKSDDAFLAFCRGTSRNYNAHDLDVLKHLLYKTPIGIAAVSGSIDTSSSLGALLNPLLNAAESSHGASLSGTYLTFHGSHLEPNHYVVRATRIAPSADRFLEVEDRLSDPKNLGNPIRKAFGLATIVGETPHIVTFRHDNSRGFNLLIIQARAPEEGPPEEMAGHMYGMTKTGRPFARTILMRRVSTDDIASLLPQTGIREWKQWPAEVQSAFRYLADNIPKSCFPDPLLSIPQK